MSQAEEDPELRELVTEALEKSGVLAAVRAHLRAGVFLALEREHDQKRSHHAHLHQMLNTHDGRLALLLVHELLEFCRLRHTASVYSAETGQPNAYTYKGRESLIYDLKLTNENTHLPVLVQLISVLFKLSKPSTSNIKNSVELNSQDNYDTTFTSDSTNHSLQDRSKASLVIDLNGSEENDRSSEHVEEDKFSSVSEQSLGNDAHIELHTDSEKSYSNVASLKPLNESVSSEGLSDDTPLESIVKDMSTKIDEIPQSEHSDRSDVLNEIEDNSVISKLDVLSDNPSQNSSKTQINESIIEEIIENNTDKSSVSSSHVTEVPSSKYSVQNLSDETSSLLVVNDSESKSKSQIDPKSGNSRKKLVKENVKSKPQVSKSKINLNIPEKRHSKPLKKTNDLFPHTQDKINAAINKSAIPSGNKVNLDKNSSKLVKATQIDNVNGSE